MTLLFACIVVCTAYVGYMWARKGGKFAALAFLILDAVLIYIFTTKLGT